MAAENNEELTDLTFVKGLICLNLDKLDLQIKKW